MSKLVKGAKAGKQDSTPAGGDRVVVAVRIRPLSTTETEAGVEACVFAPTKNSVVIRKKGQPGAVLKSQQEHLNEYAFDAAFSSNATQHEVYSGTAAKHVPAVLQGTNVTVIAYGATGAGKTHTMMGSYRRDETTVESGEEEAVNGIIPQALVDVFQGVEERKDEGDWSVEISYCEVYNENVYDLLQPTEKSLKVLEDPSQGVVSVQGLSALPAKSPTEVLSLLEKGNTNRTTESTAANQVSSRSHAILWVTVRKELTKGTTVRRQEAKLTLIDLAGSERASATLNRGARLREGANINTSLLALANCINALTTQQQSARGRRSVVNYRDSKLTHLLKSSLEGKCRMIMVANINPSNHCYEDSHNTLKYAHRAKEIKVTPEQREMSVDLKQNGALWVKLESEKAMKEKLEEQVRELQARLVEQGDGMYMAPSASDVICGVVEEQQQQQEEVTPREAWAEEASEEKRRLSRKRCASEAQLDSKERAVFESEVSMLREQVASLEAQLEDLQEETRSMTTRLAKSEAEKAVLILERSKAEEKCRLMEQQLEEFGWHSIPRRHQQQLQSESEEEEPLTSSEHNTTIGASTFILEDPPQQQQKRRHSLIPRARRLSTSGVSLQIAPATEDGVGQEEEKEPHVEEEEQPRRSSRRKLTDITNKSIEEPDAGNPSKRRNKRASSKKIEPTVSSEPPQKVRRSSRRRSSVGHPVIFR